MTRAIVMLRHERSLMLGDLSIRANRALHTICKGNVARPYEADNDGYLLFFTQVVACLEGRAARACQLVEEKSRDLLGRTFSCIFIYLLSLNPYFNFNAAIAPVTRVTQGDLASWVDNHVDDLIKVFSLADDVTALATEHDGADDDDDDGDSTPRWVCTSLLSYKVFGNGPLA